MNKTKKSTANKAANAVQNGYYDIYRLGEDPRCHVSTNSFETRLNNNVMVIGGSGAGKTTSVSLPMLLHSEYSNLVAIFTKRPLMMKVARYLKKKRNMDINILDISCPANSTIGYDPLRQCKTRADVRDLCRSIVYKDPAAGSQARDPYWEESAVSLLECFMEYARNNLIMRHGRFCSDTMINVLELLDEYMFIPADVQRNEDYAKTLQGKISERLPKITSNTAVIGAWNTFTNLANTTARCIVSSMRIPVDTVFNSEIRELLEKGKQFDINCLLQKDTALFICMSPVSTAHQRFAALVYSQLFKNLFEVAEIQQPEGRLPYPVNILCDDFGTSPIANFEAMTSIMREKNICTTVLIQSLSQLRSTYGDSGATTICNNMDRTVYLGSNDYASAVEIAQRADLLTADVLTMAIGKEIFFQRGQKPILTNCYNVFTDPAYAEMLKVAAEAEKEEKEQERRRREEEERMLYEELNEISDLGNIFQEE